MIAPQDLRTHDPTVAQEIYVGRFTFAGRTEYVKDCNPFNQITKDYFWQKELHQFRWLSHLQASQNEISVVNANALVKEWIITCRKNYKGIEWLPEVAAIRLISWICNAPTILTIANHSFYKIFLQSIGKHISFLQTCNIGNSNAFQYLQVRIALAYAALCVSGIDHLQKSAYKNLDNALKQQILSDGLHISRNPSLIPEILIDLLPLREVYIKQNIQQLPSLIKVIEKMILAMRFFRHGDGNLALFNGATSSKQDMIATILRYDNALVAIPDSLDSSGYQRISSDNSLVIMDTGIKSSNPVSTYSHAGCLSLEFSHGRDRIITNCGTPEYLEQSVRQFVCTTAAHSTAVINNTSYSRTIAQPALKYNLFKKQLDFNLPEVICERKIIENNPVITAEHNGYLQLFKIYHLRMIMLSKDGNTLSGKDRFRGEKSNFINPYPVAIRFHLHPDIRIKEHVGDEKNIILITKSKNNWVFKCKNIQPVLEKSIFFASNSGMCMTMQIVLNFNTDDFREVSWSLSKIC